MATNIVEPLPPRASYSTVFHCIRKAEHIFKTLGRTYVFSVTPFSELPMLVYAPDDSVGILTPISHNPPPAIADELHRFQAPLPPLEPSDLPIAETAAHEERVLGLLTRDPVFRAATFERTSAMYRSVLLACAHPSLAALLENIEPMSTKLVVAPPIPDLLSVPIATRRIASHCLAGVAVCALMGPRDLRLCFGLASAAVVWEPHHPLELANVLRIQVMVTGITYLGMVRVPAGADEAEFLGFGEMSPLQHSVLKVYVAMSEKIVLPLVLRHGSATMLQGEKRIIPVVHWEQVWGLIWVLSV